MCGIAGGYFWDGIGVDAARAAVSTMVTAVHHRGPDGHGLYASTTAGAHDGRPFVVLGHARLAIIDVSDAGAQPMGGGSPDAPWVTFNGEIYNYASLRTRLETAGATFRSHSDTETLLRGYEAWGLDVVQHLRGMFAFALWDPKARRLSVARDRLGIKPIYWYRGPGFVLFASEVRALLATGLVPRTLNATAAWQYLGYQAVPAPRTLIAGVHAMAPASWMTLSEGGACAEGQYWHMLDSARTDTSMTEADAHRLTGDALRDSVAAHMVSDVPVAAFLSGGIDSSAVVGLMRECGVQPRTFSVGFEERAFDESAHAALVAQRFDALHTQVRLSGPSLLDQLPAALDALDQPSGDAVNTYLVSGAVRSHGIKVALSGLGGDEIFGGYPSFARLVPTARAFAFWGALPSSVRRAAAAMVRATGFGSIARAKLAAMVASDGTLASLWPLTRQVLLSDQRERLVGASLARAIDDRTDPYVALLSAAFDGAPHASTFAQVAFAEARTYMHDVLLRDTDQMSMAHALEVRVPLLDHELIELVGRVPDAHKVARGTPKRLLVDSLGGLLPDEIVHRPKQGFTLPFDPWMRGPLRAFCEERLGERGLAGRGIVSPDAVRQLWDSFINGGRDVSWSRLWVLVVLDAWLERNGVDA